MPVKAVRACFPSDRSEKRDFCLKLKSLVAYIVLREKEKEALCLKKAPICTPHFL